MMLACFLALLALQDPTAAEGYTLRKVADASFPMFACLDDRGRLYVTESSGGDLYEELKKQVRGCKVRRFEDKDGDGVYESSEVVADQLTPSMGIAWRDGKLYVADAPDLVVFEDGRRRVLLHGFGALDNGSLHGLTFGPDGLLYMTTGEPDGYSLTGRDGKPLKGVSGALLRCRPDGTNVEVVARGFENLVEVVFLPGGDILGTCNWYQKPEGGIRDAIVHIVDGGLYPYCPDQGTPQPVTGAFIPPLALFPAVALSGFARLSTGDLVSAQHNSRKVVRHKLTRVGSTYTAEHSDLVSSANPDFHPSDVLEAPDGSILVVDTGAWYVQHCPTGKIRKSEAKGGIWRVVATKPAAAADPARIPIDRSVDDLVKQLPDPAASRALSRLASTAAAPKLAAVLDRGTAPQKLAAAEALATCGTAESIPALWSALEDDPDPILEHALIHAALRLGGGPDPKDVHPRVRKALLVIRDQAGALGAEDLVPSLSSADADLRRAALKILQKHKDWAPLALPLVDAWLAKPEPGNPLADFVAVFQSNPALQKKIGAAMDRVDVLEAVAGTTLTKFPDSWKTGLAVALDHADAAVRLQAVRTIALLGFSDYDPRLAELADRADETASLRFDALRARVGRHPELSPVARDFLLAQVGVGGEAVTRIAAAEILRRAALDDANLARILESIRGDGLVAPSLFVPALRKAGAPALEAAAESIRRGWRPSATELGSLLAALPADARALVEKAAEESTAKLAAFEPLLKGGDAVKGRELFYGKKVACGTCHRVGPQGGKVGPDLTKIGAIRAGRDILESILLPSSTFAQGYEPYMVLTQDGTVISGLIARQTADAVTLRDASGAELQLRRDRIKELKRAEKSIMPEGLERALSREEFADLLAYLQSLR